jgi:hypothetical protein
MYNTMEVKSRKSVKIHIFIYIHVDYVGFFFYVIPNNNKINI